MKVLLLTCSTGEGHNSAANALAERLALLGAECKICDPLAFKSEKAAKRAADMYNGTIKRAPLLFGLVYLAGKIYDCTRLPSPVYRSNAKYAEKLYLYIINGGFDRVICTHLSAMQAMTEVKRKFNLSIPVYGVLTDYTSIPFYRETNLDGYFTPAEEVKRQLIRKGITEEKIYVTGIPVRAEFTKDVSKSEAREKLGINRDKSVIALCSGGVGCGKIYGILKALLKCGKESEIYVFTGKNEKLNNKLSATYENNGRVKIIAFTPDICAVLRCADVILSKAGGLSSTEAAAMGAPLVHLKSIPGCETANRRYFSKNGLAVYAPAPNKAARAAYSLLKNEEAATEIIINQRKYINRFAANDIICKVIG